MNKQIIIAIIILIILGLGVAGLTKFYLMQKSAPAIQKSAIQVPTTSSAEPVAVPYSSQTYPQKVLEERLMTAEEKTQYGIAADVQAKIKIVTSPYNPNEKISIVELPQ